MLDTLLNRRLSDAECTAFHASYEEFIDLLHSLTAQSCRSPLDLLHELARLQSSLMRLQERIIEKESPQASLLKSALLLTNFEIRLIFTRLRYPSIADPVSVEIPKSPLFLSEQFTPTDIMELATALQLSGAIRRIDGTRVDLATLVDVLSGTFNVRINNPEQCRHTLINRKLSDAFSRHPAQQSDCLQPAIGSLFSFSITLRGFISRCPVLKKVYSD